MPVSAEAINHFLMVDPASLDIIKDLDAQQTLNAIEELLGITPIFITESRLPQLHGLLAALYAERFIAFFDMRMGKTKLALDWASQLALAGWWDKGKGLIIVPSPILLDVWKNQAKLHSVLSITCVGTKLADFDAALTDCSDLIVVAWSGLQAMFTDKNKGRKGNTVRKPMLNELHARAKLINLAIIDEIHACKNPQSLRFAIGQNLLTQAQFRMGLTGTPWGRNPMDAWAQSYLIDAGEALSDNYRFFESAFGKKQVIKGAPKWAQLYVFDRKKLPILQRKLSGMSMSYRRAARDQGVYQSSVKLTMRGDQAEAYKNIMDSIADVDLGDRKKIENTFVRLRQISSGFHPFIDDYGQERVTEFKSNAKMEWLTNFAIEMGPDLKCIFFHEFIKTGMLIGRTLTRAKVSHTFLNGATADKPEAVRRFMSGKAQCLIANSASGSIGVDFSQADYQAFCESPISPTVRLQAEQRAQGAAREGRPLYIDDIIASPIELRIQGILKDGKDCLSELFRNPRKFLR